jgi:hypothetical protein
MSVNNRGNFGLTTLAAAITTTDGVEATVTSGASFPAVPFLVTIGTEILKCTDKGAGDAVWVVTRGEQGSTAATHLNGVEVSHNITAGDLDDITLAQMADLARDKIIGRATASTGIPEAIDCTAAGRALLDDANAAAQIATLGLDADIATLALPANTTITAAGAALIDDANAAAQLVTIGALPIAGGTMAGNIVMPDGGTIGQAAGPLLNFDDTNNYLEITGANVGIGSTAPLSKLAINGGLHVGGDSDAGDNNLLVDGRGTIVDGVRSFYYNINDDAVASFTIACPCALLALNSTFPLCSGLFYVYPGAGIATKITALADVNTATGVLTGTTGTDGKVTISCYNTTSTIYIENRSGAFAGFYVTLLSPA